MTKSTALFLAAFAAATAIHSPSASAKPRNIEECRTINEPGSYVLANNLEPTDPSGNCLIIAADFVSIDLAGFAIIGHNGNGMGISSTGNLHRGLAVRNGIIAGFFYGVH